MVEVSAEWALVLATAALVVANVILVIFTWRLGRESHALTDVTKLLAEQARRQVEVAKVQAMVTARPGVTVSFPEDEGP